MSAAQGQRQTQCQGTIPISNPSCNTIPPMQYIIQVGNETFHHMQPMQPIQLSVQHRFKTIQTKLNEHFPNQPTVGQNNFNKIQNWNEKLDAIKTSLSRMQSEINNISASVSEVRKMSTIFSNSYD